MDGRSVASQNRSHKASQSDVFCLCPDEADAHVLACPWVRGEVDGEIIGHVKNCPVSGDPCPCLPGSIAEAHCSIEARMLKAPNVKEAESSSANPGGPFGV